MDRLPAQHVILAELADADGRLHSRPFE
jgi:hypothetical protein